MRMGRLLCIENANEWCSDVGCFGDWVGKLAVSFLDRN